MRASSLNQEWLPAALVNAALVDEEESCGGRCNERWGMHGVRMGEALSQIAGREEEAVKLLKSMAKSCKIIECRAYAVIGLVYCRGERWKDAEEALLMALTSHLDDTREYADLAYRALELACKRQHKWVPLTYGYQPVVDIKLRMQLMINHRVVAVGGPGAVGVTR